MMKKNLLRVFLVLFMLARPLIQGWGIGATEVRAQEPNPGPAVDEKPGIDQPLHFFHPQGLDGINVKDVTAVCQDRTGFIWIGTATGLHRYDGYRLRVFRHDPADPHSLGHNDVTDIVADDRNRLWVSTNGGGVSLFDPISQSFTNFRHDPDDPNTIGGDVVFSVFLDSKGLLWCGGPPRTWLNRFDPANRKWTRFTPGPDNEKGIPPLSGIWEIVEDDAGRLWLAADFSLLVLSPETGAIERINLNPVEKRLNELLLDGHGLLWCGGTTGLYQVEIETGQVLRNVLSLTTTIDALLQDASGHILVGTEHQGLFDLDRESGRILHHHQHDPTDDTSLSGDNVAALFQDATEMIWIGTSDGLDLLNPKQTQFTNFIHHPRDEHSLAPGRVEALNGDSEGNVWIAAGGRINRLTPDNGEVRGYPLLVDRRILSLSSFSAIFCDHSGRVWFGLRSNPSLFGMDPVTGYIDVRHPMGDESPQGPPPEISGIIEDREGHLFLAIDHYGLFVLNPERSRFTAFRPNPVGETIDDPDHLADGRPTALAEGREGRLWIGSAAGVLSALDQKTGRLTHFFPDYQNPKGLPGFQILDIHEDRTGVVWLATLGGLVRFDPKTRTARIFTDQDGLPSLAVVGILEDQTGCLWLETQSGLSRFNPEKNNFFNYYEADGLVDNDLTPKARWRSKDDRLFFGGEKGVSAFKTSDLKPHILQPRMVLTELLMFNQLVAPEPGSPLTRPIWETRQVVLPYNQNVLSIEFALFSFLAPERNHYRFIMEGLDQAPQKTGGYRPRADYAHLPPGRYVFKVTGSDHHGRLTAKSATLDIIVQPPWWSTILFRVTVFSLALALMVIGFRLRIKTLKKRKKELEQEVATRTADLTASEQRFATVMNSMDVVMFVTEFDSCRLLFTNQRFRQVFGQENHRTCRQVMQPDQDGPCRFCTRDTLIRDGKPTGVETWESHVPQARAWFHHRVQAIHWVDDRLVRLEISTDITHLKQIEDQLREAKDQADSANQAKSIFLANMSHELRTPLNAVIGFSQIMRRKASLPKEDRDNLEIIMRSGEHLLDLINQVLDLSKIEAGRITLDPADFDLAGLLEDIRQMFAYKTRTKGLNLELDVDPNLPGFIHADRVKLRQILINLLNNAIKFTKVGGVTLRVSQGPEADHAGNRPMDRDSGPDRSIHLLFEVIDTGPGISPEEISKLFQAFVQTESGRRSQEGTGLGLTISRRFVELMGGRLEVKSDLGQGTTFHFRIAVAPASAPRGRSPMEDQSWDRVIGLKPGLAPPRILVADDQPTNRQLMIKILDPLGFALKEAQNGEEVLTIWREWRPQLILMDIRMPALDGLEATRKIRAEETEAPTKIVAVTAGGLSEDPNEATRAGCDDFLRKPFKTEQLLHILQRLLPIEFALEDRSPQDPSPIQATDLGRDPLPEDLKRIPPNLLWEFKQAVDRVNFDQAQKLVRQMESLDRPLAGTLARLLDSYRFDRLQAWLDNLPHAKES